jgi:tRNA pseudouridine38-40 synthase
MPSFKITLAYDGTDYVGWQRQANGVSIQGLIEDALRDLDGRDVTVAGAGRTDAGVHALGQVAAFTLARELSPDALVRALNAHLPHAVRVVAAEIAPPSFHPRFGARTKTYRYQIWHGDVMSPFERRYAWHVPGPLDVEAMRAAARLVEGRHDFAAFQATGSSVATTEREVLQSAIESRIESATRTPQSAMLTYEVVGTGFLRHMVRIIVGSLVEVGRGRRPADWMGTVIASKNRALAGPTAPPDGLFLVRVDYPAALVSGS